MSRVAMLPSRSRLKALVYAREGVELAVRYAFRQPQGRKVWITFDDGPHPNHTTRILDTLHGYQVRATFFWIGKQAERYPEIVQRAVDDGHCLGNHSYSHQFLTQLNRTAIYQEIMLADEVLAPYRQNGMKLFRPPHGDHDAIVDQVAEDAGYQTVMWNCSTRDWSRPFQPYGWVTLGSLLVRMMKSSIVLMHADLPGTADHLEKFLDHIKRLDAEFMPPETLLTAWHSARVI